MTTPQAGAGPRIRRVTGPQEYPRLVEIWRTAVDATHDFLADEHRDEIESRLASDYLPQVELYGAELGGVLVGFAGVAGPNLEMLFVDARHRSRDFTVVGGSELDEEGRPYPLLHLALRGEAAAPDAAGLAVNP